MMPADSPTISDTASNNQSTGAYWTYGFSSLNFNFHHWYKVLNLKPLKDSCDRCKDVLIRAG